MIEYGQVWLSDAGLAYQFGNEKPATLLISANNSSMCGARVLINTGGHSAHYHTKSSC